MPAPLRVLPRPRRLRLLVVCLAVLPVLAALLTGCGGSSTKQGPSPSAVMAAAKKKFDEASSVHIQLSTTSTPTSGNAVLAATGDVTHAPAFEGNVKVLLGGFTATVPVTSLDGKVYAKLPLQTKYAVINPAEYGAPDPADFAKPQSGLSSLLTDLVGLKKGKQERQGDQILTQYAGTLPGRAVKAIIPSAAASATYPTTIGVDAKGYASTVKITGPFFSGSDSVTYDVVFDHYDQGVKITAPTS